MRFRVVFALCIAASLAAPALADDKDVKTIPANKKICRKVEKTGSIMPATRMCHTAAEWAKIDGVMDRETRRLRDSNAGSGRPDSGL